MPCDGDHPPDDYGYNVPDDYNYNSWEQGMTSADIVRRKLQADIDRAAQHLERLDRYGDDPFEDGTVIAFDKTFPDSRTYSYAAIRANGQWYTTGPKSPKGYEWFELREFIGDGEIYWAKDMDEWGD